MESIYLIPPGPLRGWTWVGVSEQTSNLVSEWSLFMSLTKQHEREHSGFPRLSCFGSGVLPNEP